jgi:butyryl-CoA dehydrogenase
MQLPFVLELAANGFFSKASVSIGGGLLTVGNANLLMAHGTESQKNVFALNEFNGRFSGTMCLSEPQAGSSLSDIVTRATPDGDQATADPLGPRYRLRGNKMWISAGEHELSENIIHLVLAKIPDSQGRLIPGVKGISLFIVPKHLVGVDGQLTGERNDVALAGLNHKCAVLGRALLFRLDLACDSPWYDAGLTCLRRDRELYLCGQIQCIKVNGIQDRL